MLSSLFKNPHLKEGDQHEVSVIQFLFKQLNALAHHQEIAEISQEITLILDDRTPLETKAVHVECLRRKMSNIHINEKNNPHQYPSTFYDALFSFLLLLTKYYPTNNRYTKSDALECPIALEEVKPNSRLLTSQGCQFDANSLADYLTRPASNRNPVDGLAFSDRELDYLQSRAASAQTSSPEIPLTDPELKSYFHSRCYKYVVKNPKVAIATSMLTCLIASPFVFTQPTDETSHSLSKLIGWLAGSLFFSCAIGMPVGVFLCERFIQPNQAIHLLHCLQTLPPQPAAAPLSSHVSLSVFSARAEEKKERHASSSSQNMSLNSSSL